MQKKVIAIADAKAHLSECVQSVQEGNSVIVTRYGKPVVALVRTEDLEQLERLRAAGTGGGLASLAGGWDSSEELVAELKIIKRSPLRDLPESL